MKAFQKISLFLACLLFCAFGATYLKYQYGHLSFSGNTSLNKVLNEDKDIDYLFIGSSHTRLSYDLKMIENRTQTNSYLVAFNGLSYVLMYPLLKELLESVDTKIRTIIVENYVYLTATPPAFQDQNLFAVSPPKLKTAYLNIIREFETEKTWKDLYNLVVQGKNPDIISAHIVNHFIDKQYYNGAYINRNSGHMPRKKFENLESPFETTDVELNPHQLSALDSIIALLNKHQIKMISVESPMSYRIETDRNYQYLKQKLAAILNDKGIRYIDGAVNFPVEDHTNFIHRGHLSTKGRSIYTRKIMDQLTHEN